MKKSIRDIDVAGKRCFVRVDFNVPISATGEVADDNRIRGALPTIRYLSEHGAKVILCSHLGRPKGQVNEKYSLRPVAARLQELLGRPVILAKDVIGEDAKAKAAELRDGDVLLLENVRFHAEEEKNDPAFAKELASFADIFVNDAFGTAHRAHASTEGISHFVKDSVSGFLIAKELEVMGGALEHPARPFVAILGGSKVSDKIGVISNLLTKVNSLLIGGGMAYTFLKAQGFEVGTSLCEPEKLELAKELMQKAKEKGVEMMLPYDVVAADAFRNDANIKTVAVDAIPADYMGLDIGPKTVAAYANVLHHAGTILWNGPMGVFEMESFANGTKEIAKAVAESNAVSIIGGGDSAAAVTQMGYADQITHISTGGGASLEFLEGLELPGIACLNEK